jgi:hypothetical protein
MIEHAEEGMCQQKSEADQLGWKDRGEGRRTQKRRRRRHLTDRLERCSWSSWFCLLVAAHPCSRHDHSTTIAFTPPFSTTHFHRTREEISSKTLFAATISAPGEGLSRYYQNILSRTSEQQRFVTGKYPVIVTVVENPTRKWLDKSAATLQLLVNGTSIDRSVASYDRFQWLAKGEREELHNRYATASLQLLAEIHMTKPGYVNILTSDGAGSSSAVLRHASATTPLWNRWNRNSVLYEQLEDLKWQGPYRDRLWVSGFTLAGRKGIVKSVDVDSGHIDSVNSRSESMALWPNEVCSVPAQLLAPPSHHHHSEPRVNSILMDDDALLVSDGFLVPGKDRGGVYVIRNPGNPHSEWTTCLTDQSDRWFYHRYVLDGKKNFFDGNINVPLTPFVIFFQQSGMGGPNRRW